MKGRSARTATALPTPLPGYGPTARARSYPGDSGLPALQAVSPAHRLIIVRNGLEWGIPGSEWYHAFYDAAGRL